MTSKQLIDKYGIDIVENGYYDWRGNYIRLYDMYSADGCCWDKGFSTIKAISDECIRYQKELLSIKNKKGVDK